MIASSVNESLLADLDSVQARLAERYLRVESMAALGRRYAKDVEVFAECGAGDSLCVRIRLASSRSAEDEGVISYLIARINNVHLLFGGARLVVAAPASVAGALRLRLEPESRMKEIYGEGLRVEFATEATLEGLVSRGRAAPAGAGERSRTARVVGMDIGGTNVKTVLYERGAILKQDIRKTPILNAPSTDALVEELVEAVGSIAEGEAGGIGICWPAPVVDGRIVTPIKIPNINRSEGLDRIGGLRSLLEERLGLPVSILNDGAAGALSIAKTNGLTDALCIGLGYSVAAGFISSKGGTLPQMELCAATMGFEGGAPRKVREFLSLKFGIPYIAEQLGLRLEGATSLEKAEYLVNLSKSEYTEQIGCVFVMLGMYLAEMIASAYDILGMRRTAVFGGLTKNELILKSAERWLKTAYGDLPMEFINTKIDNQFINAVGAALSILEG
jgi:hypothetical protein